jgi:antitoxin ChpS
MELKIQSWGNSAAVRLSQVLLKQINSEVGGTLNVEVSNGVLVLKPAEPVYAIEDLLADCTSKNMKPNEEDSEWLNAPPVGHEV